MTWTRSAAAVAAAVMLLNFMDATLGQVLVSALAETPPTDEASFLAVRNRPGVLAATVVIHALAALLVGYVLGKIAGRQEVRHAIIASAVVLILYAVAFAGDNPMLPPLWVRAGLLLVTPPALVAGAYVRGEARTVRDETGDSRDKEPS